METQIKKDKEKSKQGGLKRETGKQRYKEQKSELTSKTTEE